MSEKLQQYALIAEIIGGVAILLSLLFVGIQINQNSEMIRAQTRDSLSGKQIELYLAIGSSTQAMDIYTRGRAGLIQHADNDAAYTSWLFLAFANLRAWENEWYQYEKGLFEEEEYSGRKDLLSAMLTAAGYSEVWEVYKWQFSPGFQLYVDSLASPPEIHTDNEEK